MTKPGVGPQFDALFDVDVASPSGSTVLTRQRVSDPRITAVQNTRVVAEVHLRHGGMGTRALLGGSFTSDAARAVTLVRLYVEESDIMAKRTDLCPSRLGRPLLCGLPEELGEAALSGLVGSGEPRLPGGVLVIDRAAHDPVGSSEFAFRLVGDFLVFILATRFAGSDVDRAIDGYTQAALRRRA